MRLPSFPSVTLCHACRQAILGWMLEEGLAHGNVLTLEFFDPTPVVWVKSEEDGFHGVRLRGFKVEVKNSC